MNEGTVTNSYATGVLVSCFCEGSFLGGLVGNNGSTPGVVPAQSARPIRQARSPALARSTLGAFVGFDENAGDITDGYWDTTTSGITDPAKAQVTLANEPGITGLTTAQLQSGLPTGFDPAVWGQSPSINGGLPYLLDNPPP